MGRRTLIESFLFLFLFSGMANSTLIIPSPINRQVKEAHAAIQGVNNGQLYKRDNDGNVLTEYSFKLTKSVGIRTNRIINRNAFKIVAPGGKWDGKVYKTIGAPKFVKGKEYILLLDKSSYGFSVHGLSLGQYEVVIEDGKSVLKSFAFPEHKKLGTISYEKFKELVSNNFNREFEEASIQDINIYKKKDNKKNGRRIASLDEPENENGDGSGNLFWLALIFGILGVFASLNMKKH